MTSPYGRLVLIVNPEAGGRQGRRGLDRLLDALRSLGLDHVVRLTRQPGDATALARTALEEGDRFLVAVGGDGTVHEVVNGMFATDGAVAADAVLGVVPAGSGCDLVRTFGLPPAPMAAAARLAGSEVRPVDLVRIAYLDRGGGQAVRCFVNIAECGLGASTAARAARLPRGLGMARYFVAFWLTLPGYRPGTARITVDGETAYDGRAVNVVAANCRFFGGGMQIAPRSDPADGALDVMVFAGPKTDSFTMLPRVYKGSHVPHRNIVELKGRRFVVEPDRPYQVEADGEVLGTTPTTLEVLPRALQLKV